MTTLLGGGLAAKGGLLTNLGLLLAKLWKLLLIGVLLFGAAIKKPLVRGDDDRNVY